MLRVTPAAFFGSIRFVSPIQPAPDLIRGRLVPTSTPPYSLPRTRSGVHTSLRPHVVLTLLVLLAVPGRAAHAQATPLTLEAAIARAEANNPLIRQQRFAAEAAVQRVRLQKAAYLPVLAFTTGVARANVPPQIPIPLDGELRTVEAGSVNSMQLRLSLDQVLFDFGKTKHALAAARYEEDAREAAYDRQVVDVLLQIKMQFYRARFYSRLDSLYGAAIPLAEELGRLSEARVANGAALPIDVLRAQVDLQDARARQAAARGETQKSLQQLAGLLGQEQPDFVAVGALPALPEGLDPALLYDDLYRQALASRQDIRQLAIQGRQQEELVRAAEAQGKPTLLLQGSASYLGPKSVFGVDAPGLTTFNARIGVSLTYNLLGPYTARLKAQEVRALGGQVAEQQRHLRLLISTQIRTLLSELTSQQAVLASSQALAEQARANVRLLDIDYRNGAASLLDYTNALLTDASAQAALEQARFNIALALLQLESTVGSEIHFVSR